jgi:hypothetical protein
VVAEDLAEYVLAGGRAEVVHAAVLSPLAIQGRGVFPDNVRHDCTFFCVSPHSHFTYFVTFGIDLKS